MNGEDNISRLRRYLRINGEDVTQVSEYGMLA
jgi:hypothetical protein